MVCFPSHLTNNFYLFWAPLMAFDCLLLGLAVYRGLQTLKRSGSFGRKLLIVLIRDSVMYFFACVHMSFHPVCFSDLTVQQNIHDLCGIYAGCFVCSGKFCWRTFAAFPNNYICSSDDTFRSPLGLHSCDRKCSQQPCGAEHQNSDSWSCRYEATCNQIYYLTRRLARFVLKCFASHKGQEAKCSLTCHNPFIDAWHSSHYKCQSADQIQY